MQNQLPLIRLVTAMCMAFAATALGAEENPTPTPSPDAAATSGEQGSPPPAEKAPSNDSAPVTSDATKESLAAPPIDPEDLTTPDENDETPLLTRAQSEAAWQKCVSLFGNTDAPTKTCLESLRREHPGTAAFYRAEGALSLLAGNPTETRPAQSWEIPAGRLELSSTAGLFGIWAGTAMGISTSAFLEPDPALAILGTGALAIGVGTGLGFGGYHLAERLDLGEGDSRLVASSLVWGTVLGIAALPPVIETLATNFTLSPAAAVSVPLATIVSGGLAGGALALAATRFGNLSSAEVSMINTGGWVGMLFGFLTLPTLEVWNINSSITGSLSFIGATSLGLTSGYLLSQVLDFNWGETLLLDLGGVLGLVTGGTLLFALTASGALSGLPEQVAVPVVTAGLGLSTLSGLALTALSISMSRSADRPIWKSGGLEVRPSLGLSHVVLDLERKPVWILGSPTIVF